MLPIMYLYLLNELDFKLQKNVILIEAAVKFIERVVVWYDEKYQIKVAMHYLKRHTNV